MVSGDQALWTKIVSPALRDLIPGSTTGVSPLLVDDIPFEDCGDFVWALVGINRGAPATLLADYVKGRTCPAPDQRELLLRGALEAPDFYEFPEGSLARLLFRLKRNVDSCEASSPQEAAHAKAFERIEDIILYLAERHPNAETWLTARRKPTATTRDGHRLRPTQKRSRANLSLVR